MYRSSKVQCNEDREDKDLQKVKGEKGKLLENL